MKKIKYGISAIVLVIIVLTSCEDFFEKVPSDLVDAKDHYQTFIDAQISQSGVFTLLQDITPNLVLVNELLADLTTVSNSQNADLNEINFHELSSANPFINTSGYYRIIIAANEVLENLPLIKERDKDFTDKEYNRLVGYLVALKSWCYLTLVQLHGEAAYIPGNITDINATDNFSYLSKDDMLNQLIIDLDTLSTVNNTSYTYNYDEESTSASNNLAQMININAIIGDIYLEKQIYDTAAMHYEAAFNEQEGNWFISSAFKTTNWKQMFMNSGYYTNENEIMFRTYFNITYGQENPLEEWIRYDIDYLIKPTQKIIDLFNSQGDKGDEYRGLDISYGISETGDVYINKYSLGNLGCSHIILYRVGDIVLKYAEALNRMGSRIQALNVLNQANLIKEWSCGIRSRVNLSPVKCPSFTTSEDSILFIEDAIMNERAMELAFEGKRWFDLMRVAHRRNDNTYLADKISEKFENATDSANVHSILMDESNWLLPYIK